MLSQVLHININTNWQCKKKKITTLKALKYGYLKNFLHKKLSLTMKLKKKKIWMVDQNF